MSRMNRALMEKMREARRLYLLATDGLTDADLATLLNIRRQDAWRLRHMMTTFEVSRGKYTAVPDDEDVLFAQAIIWRDDHDRRDHDGA